MILLDQEGKLFEASRLPSSKASFQRKLSSLPSCRVDKKVGAHSRRAGHFLEEHGHEVPVANPRKLGAIYDRKRRVATPTLDDPSLLMEGVRRMHVGTIAV